MTISFLYLVHSETKSQTILSAKGMGRLLLMTLLAGVLLGPGTVLALTVNQPAPDFILPSTTGKEIALSEFRGKKMVLIEFYAVNFGGT